LKKENIMATKEDSGKDRTNKTLVLKPGAADASEGMVPLEEIKAQPQSRPAGAAGASQPADMEYKMFSKQQPGEGYWAVAPGCADISEGRVWVAVVRKK
jgi:hypothetical protein